MYTMYTRVYGTHIIRKFLNLLFRNIGHTVENNTYIYIYISDFNYEYALKDLTV